MIVEHEEDSVRLGVGVEASGFDEGVAGEPPHVDEVPLDAGEVDGGRWREVLLPLARGAGVNGCRPPVAAPPSPMPRLQFMNFASVTEIVPLAVRHLTWS